MVRKGRLGREREMEGGVGVEKEDLEERERWRGEGGE